MEFTFHNSYIILELVPSTAISWTELNCSRKSYSSKSILLLGWSHRYKKYTVVITICLTVSKYSHQWIFLRRFVSSIDTRTYMTWVYIWVTRRVSYKKQELLTLRKYLSSSPDLVGSVLYILLSFLCCPIMCLYILSSPLWCSLRFPHKKGVRFVFASRRRTHVLFTLFVFYFVLCTLCCQFLWTVRFGLLPLYSLTFICNKRKLHPDS